MRSTRNFVATATIAVGATVTGGSGALAAGFALKEQSSQAQGSAFAGATAEAADVSYMFYNPAAMSQQSGSQASTSLSYIIPSAKADNVQGRSAPAAGGVPVGGGDGGDGGEDVVVPALSAMTSVTERLKLGMSVNVPFGLETSYNDGWAGRYHALDSELITANLNPAVSYEPIDGVAIGAGVQAQYVTAELSRAVDFGGIGNALGLGTTPANPALDGRAEIEGDDWGFGYNIGVLLEPRDGTRIGAAYRSEIEHELDGDAEFSGGGNVRATIAQQAGQFQDTGATADLTTPDMVSVGVFQEVTPKLAVMGEFQYTFWSDFQELRVEFDNPAQPDSVTPEDWDDSFFVAAGARYDVTESLRVRAGAAFDQSPIPDDTRTPRIPGNDRTWVSLGAKYAPYSWFDVNASYTHLFVAPGDIDLTATGPQDFRGDFSANVANTVDVVTVGATLRF